ncbi:MAG: class I SAM-dependent methyltransferase [Actinomycetales bacterium]|nr:MAG: class I SAM-dependent methyltransferase [Actinomycetales bacterium]
MRWEVTDRFNGFIAPLLTTIQNVVVIGGGSQEPELEILKKQTDIKIHFLGIKSEQGIANFAFLDLNKPIAIVTQQFDLLLCSQVLEHLWDLKQAITNLVSLTNPGGYNWIAYPASNFAHGSPDYFSAGY